MDEGRQPRRTGAGRVDGPCFFISHAHADAAYVKRLAGHLETFEIPVWYDEDITWGARFTQEIRRRIMDALAVIVVMSPTAEESEWVEREILEGQSHDREFFPILLAGSRLFLLAARHYFDARDGALPGGQEIRKLQAIRDERLAGAAVGPTLDLRPPQRSAPAANLSRVGSLRKVQSFLAEGEIEHADILTSSLLLESVRRLEAGWMRRRADGMKLPPDLLAEVDAVWSMFSHGTQGFQAQLARHADTPKGASAGSERDFSALAVALGWKSNRRDTTPRYGAFVAGSEHQAGFFPTLRNPQTEQYQAWHDQWVQTVMAVHLQLRRLLEQR